MGKLYQFGLYILILFIGLFLKIVIPAPIPPAVYGMIILYLFLSLKIVKTKDIEPVTTRLLDIMPFLFVPAGVAMINEIGRLRGKILLILVTIFITTFLILFVTGHVVQLVQKLVSKKEITDEIKEGDVIND